MIAHSPNNSGTSPGLILGKLPKAVTKSPSLGEFVQLRQSSNLGQEETWGVLLLDSGFRCREMQRDLLTKAWNKFL